MNLFLQTACAMALTSPTSDDTPIQMLVILLALALCVLTGITCWRVFIAPKMKKKEQPHDETPQQKPKDD